MSNNLPAKIEKIPLLSEILKGDIIDNKYYTCYPTEEHRKNDKRWWITSNDLKAMKIMSDIVEKQISKLMWNKPKEQ